MRILLIGDDPGNIGGVVNYTRPLAEKFVENGHEVHYLCTGSWNKHYNFLFVTYIKEHKGKYPFKFYEIINCPNRAMNFQNPELDIESKRIESLFVKLLDKIKPDVVHIHEMMGLPASIIKISKDKGIRVVRTFHVYWHLCPKRVMIDFKGQLCKGPDNFSKCSQCIGSVSKKVDRLIKYRIQNISICNKMSKLVKTAILSMGLHKRVLSGADDGNVSYCEANPAVAAKLEKRLKYNIDMLANYVDIDICVSNDVKRKMMEFGVPEDKLYVNHIGTSVSEKVKRSERSRTDDCVIIGNIGGVGYYKGNHILIDAFNKMKNRNKCRLDIYGWYSNKYKEKIIKGKDSSDITFFGKYSSGDLPGILNNIDLMVLPSICNDTAPQTIFESFSAGIPIVASNIGGFPDFIIDNINGMLFEAGNAEELSRILDYIVENTAVIDKWRSRIQRPKTITKNAGELIEIYSGHINKFTDKSKEPPRLKLAE